MNIFIREMRAHLKSLIIWCIGMLFMVAGGMAKYAGAKASGQSMNELMSKMPKSLQTIFGANSFDLSKAIGFYAVIFLYLVIMSTIHASMLGANIISKEEIDKTAEFLFVKPVSRTKVITSKLLAAFSNIIILNIITLISSIIVVGNYSDGEKVNGDIVILMLGMFMLQLIFMFIGTGTAAAAKKPKTTASISTGVLLLTFVLYIVIDINNKLENLKYITPFKYYDAKDLMQNKSFEPVFLILSIMIILSMLCTTYIFYKKRDLNV